MPTNIPDPHKLNTPITTQEVIKALQKCKNKSRPGEDKINYEI
jgi:hypothetical protein